MRADSGNVRLLMSPFRWGMCRYAQAPQASVAVGKALGASREDVASES